MEKQILQEVELYIEEYLKKIASKYPKSLYEPVIYTLSQKGKRVRPLLIYLSGLIYNAGKQHLLDAALGVEIFHNFTLIHDDVMDNAPVRRGQPSVFKKWNLNTAVLSGDIMMILSYEQFFQLKHPQLPVILSKFNQTAAEVCEGQQLDVDLSSLQNVSLEDYLQMIKLKTAVLPAFCLWLGATLGGAPEKDTEKLYQIGINIGWAFQIQDDWLDLFGDNQRVGKQKGGDILEHKKTILYFMAKKHLPPSEYRKFEEYFYQSNAGRIYNIEEILISNAIDKKIMHLAESYSLKAQTLLNELQGEEKPKKMLNEFISKLLKRTK